MGTTEQGESGTQFRVDYLKPSGAIGFYHPDWVVVQKTKAGEVNWIIETKGRVWEGTAAKDEALETWCERVTAATAGNVALCSDQPDRLRQTCSRNARGTGHSGVTAAHRTPELAVIARCRPFSSVFLSVSIAEASGEL